MELLASDDLFEAAADVLLEGMQQGSWTRYNSFRDGLLSCFTSDGMKNKFDICIKGNVSIWEDTGRADWETHSSFILRIFILLF